MWGDAGIGFDLVTTLDVDPPGSDTRIVRVADYPDWIRGVRAVTSADELAWRVVGPGETPWRLEVARGSTDRELAVRWRADRCRIDWRLEVRTGEAFGTTGPWLSPSTPDSAGCPADPVIRAIILTFDRPIDLDTVGTSGNTSGG